ncbi:MAG: hypothetical protein CMK59_09710 [Proteobacteria bacterium]|nr:hypothetical protein [Pseudomonadota bacterium]
MWCEKKVLTALYLKLLISGFKKYTLKTQKIFIGSHQCVLIGPIFDILFRFSHGFIRFRNTVLVELNHIVSRRTSSDAPQIQPLFNKDLESLRALGGCFLQKLLLESQGFRVCLFHTQIG